MTYKRAFRRSDMAKGVAGCCIVAALLALAVEDAAGVKLSRDGFAALIMVVAAAAAAWLLPSPTTQEQER